MGALWGSFVGPNIAICITLSIAIIWKAWCSTATAVIECCTIFYQKWAIPGLFLFIFVFSMQIFHLKIADDWIRTAHLWYWKRPLYQLSHNHFPMLNFFNYYLSDRTANNIVPIWHLTLRVQLRLVVGWMP